MSTPSKYTAEERAERATQARLAADIVEKDLKWERAPKVFKKGKGYVRGPFIEAKPDTCPIGTVYMGTPIRIKPKAKKPRP